MENSEASCLEFEMSRIYLLFMVLAAATAATCFAQPPADQRFDELVMTRPLSPEESLQAMHVRPGMKVELVAAEPLIVDPVAFDWGPDGRLWVVEMRDYPNGLNWRNQVDSLGNAGGCEKVLD